MTIHSSVESTLIYVMKKRHLGYMCRVERGAEGAWPGRKQGRTVQAGQSGLL